MDMAGGSTRAETPSPPSAGRSAGPTKITCGRESAFSAVTLGDRTNVWTVPSLTLYLNERYRCSFFPRDAARR